VHEESSFTQPSEISWIVSESVFPHEESSWEGSGAGLPVGWPYASCPAGDQCSQGPYILVPQVGSREKMGEHGIVR
jgi:hypothetical protein